MKTPRIALLAGVAAGLVVGSPAWAGAKLKIDDESSIDLGFRVQALTIFTDKDLDGDGSFDDETDFRVRRARFRLKGTVNKYMSAFIQTDAGSESGGSGTDMRIIDSWVNLKYNNWVQGFFGQHMAPSSRMATTSSGALMTIDRPNNNTKNLTWGARATNRFATATYADSNDGAISGPNAVRDVGATFFGTGSFSDTMHLKYYAGVYDGVQNATDTDDDNLRTTVRAQMNFFDAEPGYFNSSTYLGKKKTIAIGASFEAQDEVQNTFDAAGVVNGAGDYEYYSVDAFVEWPLGPGSLTAEAAFSDLDLDDATAAATQSQGDGYYFQAGYYINQWQPWFEYEEWDGDADSDLGDYDSFRIGVSYFLKGHNANIKLGYESFSPDQNFTGTNEDEIETIVLGLYTTY
jgi:hypothetical protein